MMRVLFLLLFLALTDALDQQFLDAFLLQVQEIAAACMEESGATADDLVEILTRHIPPSRYEAKCMLFCMLRNFNLLHSDGTVNRAGAIRTLWGVRKNDFRIYMKFLKMFVFCGMRVHEVPDPCETASIFCECGKDQAAVLGIDERLLMI